MLLTKKYTLRICYISVIIEINEGFLAFFFTQVCVIKHLTIVEMRQYYSMTKGGSSVSKSQLAAMHFISELFVTRSSP